MYVFTSKDFSLLNIFSLEAWVTFFTFSSLKLYFNLFALARIIIFFLQNILMLLTVFLSHCTLIDFFAFIAHTQQLHMIIISVAVVAAVKSMIYVAFRILSQILFSDSLHSSLILSVIDGSLAVCTCMKNICLFHCIFELSEGDLDKILNN